MFRRPPTRIRERLRTYTTGGGLGPEAPVKRPPPPSTSTTRFLGTTAGGSRQGSSAAFRRLPFLHLERHVGAGVTREHPANVEMGTSKRFPTPSMETMVSCAAIPALSEGLSHDAHDVELAELRVDAKLGADADHRLTDEGFGEIPGELVLELQRLGDGRLPPSVRASRKRRRSPR